MAERNQQPESSKASADASRGRFAYDGLERVIHERARLSILSSLAANTEGLSFSDLKQLCHLTDGNLSRQLQLLQEQGFVDVVKSTRNNRPHTQVLLSESGRERFLEYIAVLEGVVADAMQATQRRKEPITLPAAARRALG
ncbi:transcriptional regulator [Humisphaera borealis]|uniref:Transcriptional regulator n=1 Tax=Humisphaera borealis TaxID=2807512 RepID=A0A7M2X2U4_9BACT|nr:transcriptional regulator [Humisphaera borealis]QOV91080.1 transcriptional regulator [Humisphaera borealis]